MQPIYPYGRIKIRAKRSIKKECSPSPNHTNNPNRVSKEAKGRQVISIKGTSLPSRQRPCQMYKQQRQERKNLSIN